MEEGRKVGGRERRMNERAWMIENAVVVKGGSLCFISDNEGMAGCM